MYVSTSGWVASRIRPTSSFPDTAVPAKYSNYSIVYFVVAKSVPVNTGLDGVRKGLDIVQQL